MQHTRGNTLKLYNAQTGKELLELGKFNAYQWSPNGTTIIARLFKHWTLFNAQTGEAFRGTLSKFQSATFSPDGMRLIVESPDGIWILCNLQTGEERQLSASQSYEFSPDGKTIVVQQQIDKRLLLHSETGEKILELNGPLSCTCSPDGKSVLALWPDEEWKLYNAHTGQELLTLPYYAEMCTFSADGGTLAAQFPREQALKFFNARTGKELLELPLTERWALSPDGKRIFAQFSEHTAYLLILNEPWLWLLRLTDDMDLPEHVISRVRKDLSSLEALYRPKDPAYINHLRRQIAALPDELPTTVQDSLKALSLW